MPRVLIIDDNPNILEVTSRALRQEGYEVEAVLDARAGLRLLNQLEFDLVLVDQEMPGMRGLDFVRELKRRRHRCRIAFITGMEDPEVVYAGFPYLLKPFNATQLLCFVNTQMIEAS